MQHLFLRALSTRAAAHLVRVHAAVVAHDHLQLLAGQPRAGTADRAYEGNPPSRLALRAFLLSVPIVAGRGSVEWPRGPRMCAPQIQASSFAKTYEGRAVIPHRHLQPA